jgi:uncharacterized protein YprB with RNaseH-like and TPR domain
MDLRERLMQLEDKLGVGRRAPPPVPPSSDGSPAPLSDRLQRLVSAQTGMPRRRAVSQEELARLLGGALCANGVVVVDHFVPMSQSHGCVPFCDINEASLDFLAGGKAPPLDQLLFIDTETTGLAGGTGTVAFVLGLARIEDDVVHVRQYFLTSFNAEPAMLRDALTWIHEACHLVSFNGKSFDVPLLVTRYRLARIKSSLSQLPHLDLLHRVRTAFKKNWPDCRLQTAEQYLLKLSRDNDTPGELIPQIWTDLLRRGETGGLRGVIEHNRTDVLSLIALAIVLGRTYAEPGQRYVDALGVARAHRRAGDQESALLHLRDHGRELGHDAQLELAALYARGGEWEKAVTIWELLAARNVGVAMEKLAKYGEHQQHDFEGALRWTERMLTLGHEPDSSERRRFRLLSKIERSSNRLPVTH